MKAKHSYCTVKRGFATKADADRVGKCGAWPSQHSYHCAFCGRWHLTSKPPINAPYKEVENLFANFCNGGKPEQEKHLIQMLGVEQQKHTEITDT